MWEQAKLLGAIRFDETGQIFQYLFSYYFGFR